MAGQDDCRCPGTGQIESSSVRDVLGARELGIDPETFAEHAKRGVGKAQRDGVHRVPTSQMVVKNRIRQRDSSLALPTNRVDILAPPE